MRADASKGRRRMGATLASCTLMALSACDTRTITVRGEGPVSREQRVVDPIDSIEVEGALDVRVMVGLTQAIWVAGHDNHLPLLDTSVTGGRLVVRAVENYRLVPPPEVEVRLPAVSSLVLSGSGSVSVAGIAGGDLDVRTAGSGEVYVEGAVDVLDLSMAGSGDFHGAGLEAREIRIDKAGSGDATVHARRALRVSAAGSGDVLYVGDPAEVKETVVGSGRVVARRVER